MLLLKRWRTAVLGEPGTHTHTQEIAEENFSHVTVDQSVCSRRRGSGPGGIRDAVGVHRADRHHRRQGARQQGQHVLQQRRDCAGLVEVSPANIRSIYIMTKWINRFVRDEEGQDLVEYAMLLAFIALIAITGVKALGVK